ncbi:NAD(P)/FAD-dependent oxidoreductase [Streptomyces natalensis]|uniref:NAD(P)/FAD-dependent oxidoreductase n=1 Tax=Streptomyces natalensis TaxID=68242 RepID=UPI0005C890CA|nr:FAD-binding oxidoreductase [Streptomyces natalensis]
MARVHVAIVGAGIIGCLIAREMAARRPEASIVVLERDQTGCGASRRSAGTHIPRGATERFRRMTEYSHEYYAGLQRARPALPIRALPMAVVADAAHERTILERYVPAAAPLRTDTLPCRVTDLPERCAAWRISGGHYADVHGLTRALAAQLRPRVAFREGVEVVAVDPSPTGVTLRLGTGETLTADRLVLAPGPWTGHPAWAALTRELDVRVKKIVALHLDEPTAPDDGAVVFQDHDAFLLPLHAEGHWLYSYVCPQWDVDPDTVGRGLAPSDLVEAAESLRACAPRLAGRVGSARVFCDAYGPQGEPLITGVAGAERVVYAGAGSGFGYRLAPAIAGEAADLLCQD